MQVAPPHPPPPISGEDGMREKQLVWISVLLMGLITHEGEKGLTILRPHSANQHEHIYTEILAWEHTHTHQRLTLVREGRTALSTLPSTHMMTPFPADTHTHRIHTQNNFYRPSYCRLTSETFTSGQHGLCWLSPLK